MAIIGINTNGINNIDSLIQGIREHKENGFDLVEISLDICPLIIAGKINAPFVKYFHQQIKACDMLYSAHIGTGLNIRSRDHFEIHKDALFSSIDVCAESEIPTLVLHFEEASPYTYLEERFYEVHFQAAEHAARRGVLLFMENIEVENYKPVLEMVKTLNHSFFKMNLDFGHLFLSARHFGYSFEDAVRECAPYVGHCHLNDNPGIFDPMRLSNFDLYRTKPMGMRISFGEGDIHMPPFTCNVPLEFGIGELKKHNYRGVYICEYMNSMFKPFNREIQERVRSRVEAL